MDRKFGYLLLTAAVAFLIGSAALLVMTLYGRLSAPQPFNAEAVVTLVLSRGSTVNVPLPPHVNKAANFTVFFIGIFLLAGIGAKIGRLGVQLIQKPQPPREGSSK